jgi:RimJ/RimL family protein N-acetyltransferase
LIRVKSFLVCHLKTIKTGGWFGAQMLHGLPGAQNRQKLFPFSAMFVQKWFSLGRNSKAKQSSAKLKPQVAKTLKSHRLTLISILTDDTAEIFKVKMNELLQIPDIANSIFIHSQCDRIQKFDIWDECSINTLYEIWKADSQVSGCSTLWLVLSNDDANAPIGIASSNQPDPDDKSVRFLDVVIHPSYAARGYGTEAATLVCKNLFYPSYLEPTSELSLSEKSATKTIFSVAANTENGRIWKRIIVKLGLKSQDSLKVNGIDCELFSVSKDEYRDLLKNGM